MKNLLLLLLFVTCGLSAEARRVGVFYFFADDGKQIYEDENVVVTIGVEDNSPHLTVRNKTDRVIYIDKGSSFVYKNNMATCLFSNSAYSSGTGRMGGASVNLGGVANAIGIGGAAGSILGGVNVGGGRSSQNSTTVYEQRVMAIAPNAAYELHKWNTLYFDFDLPNPRPRKRGRTWSFGLRNTPYIIKASLRYSFDENFSSANDVAVSDYISDVVYDKTTYAKHNYLYVGTYCNPFTGRNGVCHVSGMANIVWGSIGAFITLSIVSGSLKDK